MSVFHLKPHLPPLHHRLLPPSLPDLSYQFSMILCALNLFQHVGKIITSSICQRVPRHLSNKPYFNILAQRRERCSKTKDKVYPITSLQIQHTLKHISDDCQQHVYWMEPSWREAKECMLSNQDTHAGRRSQAWLMWEKTPKMWLKLAARS